MNLLNQKLAIISLTLPLSLFSSASFASADEPEKPKISNEASVLIQLSAKGNINLLQDILTPQTDVNRADRSGETALHAAAANGHNKVIRELLKHNAELDAKNIKGSTAMLVAAEAGHASTVSLLLENGAGLRNEDTEGANALILAAYEGHMDVVKLLVDKGLELNSTDDDGASALINALLGEVQTSICVMNTTTLHYWLQHRKIALKPLSCW